MKNEKARLEYFATQWSAFEGFDNVLLKHRTKRILGFCRGKSVLEVGCADGFSTMQIVNRFKEIEVVEASQRCLEATRALVGDAVKFHLSLFEEFKTDKKFDTILLLALLEHVRDPQQILRMAKKMLAPRGRILVTVPNAGSIHRRLGVKLGLLRDCKDFSEGDREAGHRRVYSLDALRDDIEMTGLKIELIRGIGLKFLSNSQMEKLPQQVAKRLLELDEDVPVEFCSNLFAVCKL